MRSARVSNFLLGAAVWMVALAAPCAGWTQMPSGPETATPQSLPQSTPVEPSNEGGDARSAVRLSDVEGSVRISDAAEKLFDHALQNMAVLPGMSLETGNDGRAELEFPDGSVARVTPNSALAILPMSQNSAPNVSLILRAVKGLTYYELAPGGSSYSVQIGPLTARSPGSSTQQALLRVNLDGAPYQAAVLRGTMHFEDASGNAAYDLEANQTARIDPAAATDYDLVFDLTPDTWDKWNTDRDSVRAQIAGAEHPSGENAGPGWNDLNYYGSWYNLPGQGLAWAPDGVGDNFDPYGSGAWSYSTGVGYGWVSSYPWGWLPYHCGTWNYYNGNGWMWLPASCGWGASGSIGYGWYPYGTVGYAPFRYRRPSPPNGALPTRPAQTLIAVHQGPAVNFRTLGGPRPVARTLTVSGVSVQPLPAEARPTYRSVVSAPGSSYWTGGSGSRTGVRFAGPSAAGSGVPAETRFQTAPRVQVYTPAPQHMSAPPAMAAPTAEPHVAAPAPAASGHGH